MAELSVALTMAGSDPSGGAGLQADLKTFHQHGVYGASVVTLLTVQNTVSAPRVEVVAADLVAAQLDHLLADLTFGAAKTGALGNAAVVEAIAARARGFAFPLVVDPVLVGKHGQSLLDASAVDALVRRLLPCAALVTPNAEEAALLAKRPVETVAQARAAAARIGELGARAVLVKGGHLAGEPVDVLWQAGEVHELPGRRIESRHTHGTGCAYSAAITAHLAQGLGLLDAVTRARAWLTEAIRHPALVGHGVNPVNHLAPVERG